MKYARLTREQLDGLHPEFTKFLAAQSIGKSEWDAIKAERPQIAEQELDIFCDLIWEGVLARAEYLEHFSENHIFLFHCMETHLHSIVLKSLDPETDFLSKDGMQWLSDNMFTEKTDIKIGKKMFAKERNTEVFELITQGAFLSDGQLYKQIHRVIES